MFCLFVIFDCILFIVMKLLKQEIPFQVLRYKQLFFNPDMKTQMFPLPKPRAC